MAPTAVRKIQCCKSANNRGTCSSRCGNIRKQGEGGHTQSQDFRVLSEEEAAPESCSNMTPAEYESKRSGRPYSQASGDSSAERMGMGALGKLLGMTSCSGGLHKAQAVVSMLPGKLVQQALSDSFARAGETTLLPSSSSMICHASCAIQIRREAAAAAERADCSDLRARGFAR